MHVLVYTVKHASTYSISLNTLVVSNHCLGISESRTNIITLNTLVVSNDCLGKSENRTIVWVNQKVERLFG